MLILRSEIVIAFCMRTASRHCNPVFLFCFCFLLIPLQLALLSNSACVRLRSEMNTRVCVCV